MENVAQHKVEAILAIGALAMAAAKKTNVREVRRESLATRLASTASDDAFRRAVAEEDPLVDDCRVILRKPTGRRTMDDIHVVRPSS